MFGKRGQRRVHGWRLLYRLRVEMILRTKAPIVSVMRRAEVRVWTEHEAFDRIEKLLRRARHTIIIQMFIWKDDDTGRRIAAALVEAADRGVLVDITKEAVGDIFEASGDFLSTQNTQSGLWKRFWNHRNIRVRHAADHDHTKVYVIDDQLLLLTGMNIGNEYHGEWHDYLAEVRGHRFVQQYLTADDADAQARSSSSIRLVMNTALRKDVRPAVTEFLESARTSIVLEQAYISDAKIIETLIRLSNEGIRITLILPSTPDVHHHANMVAVSQLLAGAHPRSLQVLLYPGMVHGKLILVDRKRVFLGSANLTSASLDEMGEVSLLIERGELLALRTIRDALRVDILKSTPLLSPPYLGWLAKWLAWFGL
ncbi:MAG: phosphatidylserine/phosphatidylglycerophosphate/cardiolipin synthase family protein [Candidatus Peregrinibacteria bacterium]|nr:phosphatidylserine/phosphatidylglycerophosphate/cardiolipin synthase family protein [Candidatus Peregrinibacteria bacterium]